MMHTQPETISIPQLMFQNDCEIDSLLTKYIMYGVSWDIRHESLPEVISAVLAIDQTHDKDN